MGGTQESFPTFLFVSRAAPAFCAGAVVLRAFSAKL
jgi:hypothetical protein